MAKRKLLDPLQSTMARAVARRSRKDLAAATGLGLSAIARFETGKKVRPITPIAIRQFFEARGFTFWDDGSCGVQWPSVKSAQDARAAHKIAL